jgi:DnaJ family protein B protein 4
MIGGYCYQGNSFQIFEQFFGHNNPFAEEGETSKQVTKDPDAPADVIVELKCSIYEFYNGSLKTFTFFRDELMPDGRSIQKVEDSLTVEVKPGYDTDTVLRYPSKGNQAYACAQSCLVVKLQLDNTSSPYRRKGDNLIYTHTMTLEEALASRPAHILTLDGRSININLDVMITP